MSTSAPARSIDVGAAIGDESVVGHGAHIGADVQIFPYKRIEPAATVNSSLIWESTAVRSLFARRRASRGSSASTSPPSSP